MIALWIVAPQSLVAAQARETQAEGATPLSKEQLKLARSLYYDGLELLDQGKWSDAADRLQRVLAIRDSAVVSFHLANALYHLQHYVDARLLLQRVLNDPKASPDIRAAAVDLVPAAEHAMGRLTLRVDGDLDGVQLMIDGRETPTVALDVPIPVDPHEVSVIALRDGEQVAATTALVGGTAGLQVEVVLTIPARPAADVVALPPTAAPVEVVAPPPVITPSLAITAAPEAAAPARAVVEPVAVSQADHEQHRGGLLTKWWFWTAVGVVAAGAVITTVALASSHTIPADLSSVRGDFQPGLLEGTVK